MTTSVTLLPERGVSSFWWVTSALDELVVVACVFFSFKYQPKKRTRWTRKVGESLVCHQVDGRLRAPSIPKKNTILFWKDSRFCIHSVTTRDSWRETDHHFLIEFGVFKSPSMYQSMAVSFGRSVSINLCQLVLINLYYAVTPSKIALLHPHIERYKCSFRTWS